MSNEPVSPGDIYMLHGRDNSLDHVYYMVLWRRQNTPNAWDMMELGRPELKHWESGNILSDPQYYTKVA